MTNLQTEQQSKNHHYHLIPLVFILVVLPLISKLYTYDPHLSQFDWFPPLTEVADIFVYYKSVFFTITAIAMLLLILGKRFMEDRHAVTPAEFYPLAGYAVLALLSTLLSQYRSFGFSGIYEQFESVWVLLGYCVAAYYAYIFVEESDVTFLIRCFLIGVAVLTCLGLSQAFSHDFFRTDLGQKILTSGTAVESLNFTFEEDRVYMSLYNPNYVGTYAALALPILAAIVCFTKLPKHAARKDVLIPIAELVVSILLFAGLFYCLVKSGSKSGVVAVAVSLLLMVCLLVPHLKKRWYLAAILVVIIIAGIFTANAASGNVLLNSLKNLVSSETAVPDLERITMTESGVVYRFKGNDLRLEITDDYKFHTYDSDNAELSLVKGEDFSYTFEDERFSDLMLYFFPVDAYLSLGVQPIGTNTTWFFTKMEDGAYYYYNPSGYWVTLETAPSALFTGRESIATGRGYIWSRTIPLLKDSILLGTGADTFSIVFPNDDYVGLYNNGYFGSTITKPHNLYLQIGVQTGVLSLLAFLAFYSIYFVSSLKVYLHGKMDTYTAKVGFGIFIGSFAYMITGLINDSTISVAPIYWVLLGTGISINRMLTHKKYVQTENN